MKIRTTTAILLFFYLFAASDALARQKSPVFLNEKGQLTYTSDEKGNRIPDFSYAGYMAGEKAIPNAPVRIVVPPMKEDATQTIQAALDEVAALPPDEHGIRGAVLLEKGVYTISGSLYLNSPGVVLRGSGTGADGAVLLAAGLTRQTAVKIGGKNDRITDTAFAITAPYTPVNAMRIQIDPGHNLKPGDKIIVKRLSTWKWIDELSMREFGGETEWLGWKPGERDIVWDRAISAINGNELTLDAPVTAAIDSAFGGGTVTAYSWPGRIEQVGIENLRLRSTYDENNPKDENHRWMAVVIENAQDVWVRQVVFEHFAGSAVAVYETAKRVTVEDCKSLAPVSEIGGQRRYTFYTSGQQTLFQRCYAEQGYHDFATGFRAAGPNAFVQCESKQPYSFSGPIDSWASGLLYDIVNVDGQGLGFMNRGQDGQGAGWCAANSMLWQCTAAKIYCYQPPTAANWAYGSWAQFAGNGYWEQSNDFVKPRSLYYGQLIDRLGEAVKGRAQLLPVSLGSTSSPTIEQAARYAEKSTEPPVTLAEWIDQAAHRNPIPVHSAGVRKMKPVREKKTKKAPSGKTVRIKNGWLTYDGKVLTGKTQGVRWWRGDVRYYDAKKATPHITRFVPGRTGRGWTDQIDSVAEWMQNQSVVALDHNYGLWYDRRRDDHERVRRMDGEVWPPFYELPFARSGTGFAWDGLSKYDLTKYNPWYWSRLKAFADAADERGLVMFHQNYFQHNILEAGAHWADFPWRTANNINDTGFPEPPPYAGDKRIFMADLFYDVSHPKRRALHRAYIRQCLENFKDNGSVIQFVSAEFTGPLHFAAFWIDEIRNWEEETNGAAITGLSATKDVQDSILAHPERRKTVDVIDIRYWFYRDDGSLYAPPGGKNLAPRQHARLENPGKQSFGEVYRAVREYRENYPGKCVLYSAGDRHGWAVFMAGGSLANIPEIENEAFLQAAVDMLPIDLSGDRRGVWALANEEQTDFILYRQASASGKIDFLNEGNYQIIYFNPQNGKELLQEKTSSGSSIHTTTGDQLVWIRKIPR